jgi:hypothetical protein
MKRIQKLLLAITVATFAILLSVGTAQAQLTGFDTGAGAQAQAEITLTGILQSSIVLNIE